MAVNLVSLIMQFLTPDMIGRIASALGLDRTYVRNDHATNDLTFGGART